ncbi:MAG TPA: hypothetical protein VF076_07155 [Acidimicrobiales bacterium]
MAGTLADLAIASSDLYERGVIERFRLTSDFIDLLPQKTIKGTTYKYRVEEVAPGISWRDVNVGYPESTGVIAPRIESTMIVGGDVFIDNALLRNQRTGGDAYDVKASQYDMKARALARELERAYFEGDDSVNPSEMPGLRRRLAGTQVIQAGAGVGAALTLAMVDALLDAVDLSIGQPHLFMSKKNRRTMTTLTYTATGSVRINYTTGDDTGKVVERYGGVPIHVVEDGWDASTLLANDEDPGNGTATSSSIYCVVFDEQLGVCGLISGGDGDPLVSVREVGETTASGAGNPPGILGRIECYPGLMIKSPRAAARLRNVL